MCLPLNYRSPWAQQLPVAREEALEPREVLSELDEALQLADARMARCWALLEELKSS